MIKSHIYNLLYALCSAALLSLAWPGIGDVEELIFMALLPLFYLEKSIRVKKARFPAITILAYSYLTFLAFNLLTTWWIKLASPGGMIMAVAFNALFMALVFLLFHLIAQHIKPIVGYFSFPFLWTAFEYLHINWELSWIWLNFGNVFANTVNWIQWYEFTGSLGGTTWVTTVNASIFILFLSLSEGRRTKRIYLIQVSILITLLALPIVISEWIFKNYKEESEPVNVLLIQPNIDPYNDKFGGMTEKEQINKLMKLAESGIDSNTELVICPETAFPSSYREDEIEYAYGTEYARKILTLHPEIKFVTGLTSVRLYEANEVSSPTARNTGDGRTYDVFNSAMQLSGSDEVQIYRKSKLVLGVEKMPFSSRFKFLDELSINLGGSTGSLGTEVAPRIFSSITREGKALNLVPAICYESIFGEYLSEFVQIGGNLLAVVTNDGWWGNTPGYEQHLAYSRLRAIELRRSIARSANTGISAFIDQKGQITQRSLWWTSGTLKETLNLNNKVTFYAEHGDYPGRIASFVSVLLLIWLTVRLISGKRSVTKR